MALTATQTGCALCLMREMPSAATTYGTALIRLPSDAKPVARHCLSRRTVPPPVSAGALTCVAVRHFATRALFAENFYPDLRPDLRRSDPVGRLRATLSAMPSPEFIAPTPDAITRAVMAGVSAPVDEELWERRMKALTLRNAGYTFSVIAAQLGISATVVRADCRLAMREVISETIEEGVARQMSVLRDMQHGAYPCAMSGDKDSIMAIVRCLEQEAKLKGLYAPARMSVGISDVDFAEQAAVLFEKLGQAVPKELMAHGAGVRPTNGSAAVEGLGGAAVAAVPVDASEIIDGIIERFIGPDAERSGVAGFDIPAFSFPVDADPHFIDGASTDISDAAMSAAAAAAIDPERFGDADDHQNQAADQGGDGAGGWSNL